MTGDEVIALAREFFGEPTANTVSTTAAKDYLNTALLELYNDLPPNRMRDRLSVDSVALTTGQGSIPNTWDRIVDIYVNDIPTFLVDRHVVYSAQELTYFEPSVPIAHFNEESLWIAPMAAGTVKVVHLEPPTLIATTSDEITEFKEQWHKALALLIASYMYAQEEDSAQAQYFKGEYQQMLHSFTEAAEAV